MRLDSLALLLTLAFALTLGFAIAARAQSPSEAPRSSGVPSRLRSLEPLASQAALAPKERLTAPWTKVERHLRELVARPETTPRRSVSPPREVVEAAESGWPRTAASR
jgi:hypothetical protein